MNSRRVMPSSNFKSRQQGAVLAISLIILLVITIVSIQGIQTTLMQEKMTAAVRDGHVALEAAEAGLLDAEAFIETLVSTVDFKDDGSGGLYTNGNGPIPAEVYQETVWATAKKSPNSIDGIIPEYIIEELGKISANSNSVSLDTSYGSGTGGGTITGFKVISRATGQNTSTKRIVVGYYGKRL